MRCFCTKTKTYHCKVVLLDDQELLQEILNTSRGQDVLDTVFRHLNLIETSYFGLRYVDCANQTHWLDTTKKIVKQLKGKDSFTLYFGVKFYAADPCKLVEEITRYQFFLQVKQDILQGRLPVAPDLLAELGAYAVQSELGDYDARRHSPGYVSEFRFVSNQSVELEHKIAELHKKLLGQLPAVAELSYLDKVKWLEMYGVDLHPVIGEDNVEYFLGLSPNGVIVLRNKSKVQSYCWSRIKKIYFKGKYFMLRVDEKNNDENTYGFETPSRAACKHLYKCCQEHNSFFQLVHVSTNAPDVISTRFSSNRVDKLSGRSSQLGMRNPPTFVRTPSRRYQKRVADGVTEDAKIGDEKLLMTENTPPLDDSKNTTSNSFYNSRSDSPRSTRSAPWNVWSTSGPPRPQHSSHSPRSVRSAGPQLRLTHAHRSSSVESRSSTDSRPCRRHKHRSKRGSDNESELSRCSSHGHGSHRRHRHRSRRSSGSEQQEHRSHSSHNRYQLIDSESQWKEVQRRQAEGGSGVQEATVIRPGSGYINSGVETESEHSTCHHHRRKHRKHRSRSRSPSESGKTYLSDELKKHLEFQLIDTEGMSEDQLREIPYTVVKTNAAKAVRVRLSSTGKPKLHASRRAKSEDSPPPPYSESPVLSDLSNKTTSTNATVGTATSDSIKHITRLSSHMSKSSGALQRSSCSALYNSSSTALNHSNYPSQSNLSGKDPTDRNDWMSENVKFSNLGFVVGLPPQPLNRRSFNNTSHSDLALNTSKPQSQKGWPSPEIRGTVGLPPSWPDPLQSSSVSNLYSNTPSGGPPTRRSTNTLNSAADYNHLNQNPLPEPRFVNGSSANGHITSSSSSNVYRSSPKAGPQSAVTSSSLSSIPTARIVDNGDRFKKPNTLAESGVLGSHTNTPNGKIAWPTDRQSTGNGWPPKQPMNLNQMWCSNGNWSSRSGGGGGEYTPWSTAAPLTTAPAVGGIPLASSPNWLPQQPLPPPPPPPPQQAQPQAQSQQLGYRMTTDRGMMYSSQPQMQRISENITGEALAENPSDYVNCVNNNGRLIVSPNSPNNNQFYCKTPLYQQIDNRQNQVNGCGSDGSPQVSPDEKPTSRLSPSDDKNNNRNHKNNSRNSNLHRSAAQNFIQEVSTEL